jgi:hypothetical protein
MNRTTVSSGLGLALSILLAPALLASQEPESRREAEATREAEQRALEATSARIARQLERLRGREFERPFEVRVAGPEEFIGYAKERTEQSMPPERLAALETLQKMLGLLPPDIDLLAVTLEVLEDQVGGFYVPGVDRFFLMQGFTGSVAELILAHELTHALDDQLFDLDGGLEARSKNSDALAAYHAVVEGSGMVMMTRWMLAHPPNLSPEDLSAAMPSPDSLSKAPAAVWKPLLFAYMQGQSFLEAGRRALRRQDRTADANAALDQAFLAPPRSTEQVLHPEKYWNPQQLDEPREVSHDLASLPAGWQLRLSDTLGELMLALMVEAPREVDLGNPLALMGLRYTNAAAEGWDGDQVLLLEREDGARLVTLAVVLDSDPDADQLIAAFQESRPRIGGLLEGLAGEGLASGLGFWIDGERPDLVRWIGFTGLEAEAAFELARSLKVTVGPDPLAGPHDPQGAPARAGEARGADGPR